MMLENSGNEALNMYFEHRLLLIVVIILGDT